MQQFIYHDIVILGHEIISGILLKKQHYKKACRRHRRQDRCRHQGKLGYARGGKHALSEKIIDIEETKFNPEEYDVVYIGAPVWAGKIANPTLTYIKRNEGKLNNVKFFMTAGSKDYEKGFRQLEKYSITPIKTFGLTTKQVKKGDYSLDSFLE